MRGIIIYKSKYGSTKQYAEWLHDETGFELYEVKQCPADLSQYDVVVIGSNVHAGKVSLAGWIRNRWPLLQEKDVYLLLVNITADPQLVANFVPQSLPPEIATQLKVFPVGGRYLLEQMTGFDRTIIKMVASLQKDPAIKQELLTERDWVNKDNLRDLLAQINSQHNAGVG